MKIVPRCRSIILAFCPPFFISVNKTQFYAYGDTFNFRRLFNITILRYVFIDVINETVAYEYFIIDGTFYTSCGSSSINPHLSWLQMSSACFQHIITIYFDSHVSWASPTYEVFMLYVVVLSMGHFRTFRYQKKESHNLLVKIKSIICMNLVNQFKHARLDNTTKKCRRKIHKFEQQNTHN